jgi:hypothetical protein
VDHHVRRLIRSDGAPIDIDLIGVEIEEGRGVDEQLGAGRGPDIGQAADSLLRVIAVESQQAVAGIPVMLVVPHDQELIRREKSRAGRDARQQRSVAARGTGRVKLGGSLLLGVGQ